VVALVLPLTTSTAVLRGVLEAHHWFAAINAIRLPLGLVTFLGPLAVLPFSRSLLAMVVVLAVARALAWGAHLGLCLRRIPEMRRRPRMQPRAVKALVRYGGWTTVTALSSALMTHLDRFLIAAMLPLAAVAYYVTPFDAMMRVVMLPGALCAAIFPALAERFRRPDGEAGALFEWSARVMILTLFPAMLLIIAFAPEALTLWVGAEFAREGARVLQWLAVGVFILGVALVASSALGAAGRPDLAAKLNVAEVPLYLVVLFVFTREWGIAGAALAWTLRLAVDAGALLWLLARTVPVAAPASRRLVGALAFLTALLAWGLVPAAVAGRAGVAAVSLAVFAVLVSRYLLLPTERAAIFRRVRGVTNAALPGRP
jgi:O-antigen/teichoic acid export membrane protein